MSRGSLFKFLRTLAVVLSLAAVSHAQLFTLQGGNFQVAGVPVANGSVILTLSNPSATICVGGGASTPSYTINLDANGNMPLTQVLGNAALCPQGTFYTAQLFSGANGTGSLISTSTWPVGPSAPYAGTLYPSVMVLPAVSFSGGVVVPSATIAFSATPVFNAATVSKFYISLTGNVTSSTLTGSVKDQLVIFVISQDGVGSRTFTWPTNVKGQAIASGAGLTSTQAFTSDGTNFWPIGEMTVSSGTTDVRGNSGVFSGTLAAAGGLTAASMPALTGDATSSAGSTVTTVAKINGVSYPLTAPAHSVPVVTTAGLATTYKAVPDCTDTTGNHLNYTQSGDTWSCGTSVPANVVTATSTTTMTNKTVGAGGLAGLTPGKQIFTASGTFTIPAGVTGVKVTVVGGGGGGGGASATPKNGGGGGSGSLGIKWLAGLTPGNTLAVVIGAAGSSGATGAAGGNGGASSVASGTQTITSIIANGGQGGGGTLAASPGGGGGAVGSGGDLNLSGASGGFGNSANNIGGNGAPSFFSGGGAQSGGAGVTGTSFGDGGGGAGGAGANSGGAGSAGVVVFEWTT